MRSFSMGSWILSTYLCGTIVALPTLQAILAVGLDKELSYPISNCIDWQSHFEILSNYGHWIWRLSPPVNICDESQRLSKQVLKLIICMSYNRSYISPCDCIPFPIEKTIASRTFQSMLSTYSNIIVTHVFFWCLFVTISSIILHSSIGVGLRRVTT